MLHLLWALRVLFSKNFVVLTDKGSVIVLKGKDPAKFNDRQILIAQATEMRLFSQNLKAVIAAHRGAIKSLKYASERTQDQSDTLRRAKGQ